MLELRSDVTIAPLSAEHAQSTLKWLQDPAVSKNLGIRSAPSLEKTVEWIREARESAAVHAFAVFVGDSHVGNMVLDKLDDFISTARFHIFIGETNSRSGGVGRTATYLICRHAFETLQINKIWLTVHNKNFRAITTYARLGFRLEGILREEFLYENERLDVLYMGLLKTDFEKIAVRFQ